MQSRVPVLRPFFRFFICGCGGGDEGEDVWVCGRVELGGAVKEIGEVFERGVVGERG